MNTYPKLYNLGHAALKELFHDNVVVEEKVDGSQFSFGIYDGAIKCRSKGKEQLVDAPDDMFKAAIATVLELAPLLKNGYTYRGEYLSKPKHNALTYSRAPAKNIIIFDINIGEEQYLSYADKAAEAARIGLEVVPLIYSGKIENFYEFTNILDREAYLGGPKIEGVVIKNYHRFGPDKKALLAKHVSEAFKEVHKQTWGESNPSSGDFITALIQQYRTPARWQKAVQHLRENGELTNTPKDIGKLVLEIQEDTLSECEEEIKQQLYNWVKDKIKRQCVFGFPEWYKTELAKSQFGGC